MRTLSSRIVYSDPWISLRQDRVELADGTTGTYAVIDKPDFALVVPAEADGFWLVEQYRYPVRRRAWEFPQGGWGAGRSGSAEELARAELAEETGLRARELRALGRLCEAYGLTSQGCDVWLATGLEPGTPDREGSEQDMQHRFVPEREFRQMVREGQVVDTATLAAYSLLLLDRAG